MVDPSTTVLHRLRAGTVGIVSHRVVQPGRLGSDPGRLGSIPDAWDPIPDAWDPIPGGSVPIPDARDPIPGGSVPIPDAWVPIPPHCPPIPRHPRPEAAFCRFKSTARQRYQLATVRNGRHFSPMRISSLGDGISRLP